jgi:hypothetical protein
VLDVVPVVVVDVVPVLEVEANFEYVVPANNCRDRNGSKAIVLEKLSVVVGPDCPITKPWECVYVAEALITRSANLYSYVREALAYALTSPRDEN